ARAALDVLVAHPVLTAAVLARELDVSTRSARTALHTLADLGIVEPYEPQRPARQARRARPQLWWSAPELLAIVRTWGGA
ncbi:MAG: helix-turn-helix domain-containing protein, partial [Acidimicrobiia bacterium]|nr:helix-turn-helix domain-containing protein [Acidimicrobiia bacterium]